MNSSGNSEIKLVKLKSKHSGNQKCKLSRKSNVFAKNLVPGKFCLVNREILCKFYYAEEIWDDGKCFVDDSVRLKSRKSEDELFLRELEVVEEIVEFFEVRIHLIAWKICLRHSY